MTTVSAVADADLLRGAAHLLRSPLGVVLNIAATLRDYDDRFTPEMRANYLGEIVQAAEEMRVALDGVSMLARLSQGGMSFSQSGVSLPELLNAAREGLAVAWGMTETPAPVAGPGAALADSRRTAQAFEALGRFFTPLPGVTLSGAGTDPVVQLGPVQPRAAEALQARLAMPVTSPEAAQHISHSAGWALLLARHLLGGQGASLMAMPAGDGVMLGIRFPSHTG